MKATLFLLPFILFCSSTTLLHGQIQTEDWTSLSSDKVDSKKLKRYPNHKTFEISVAHFKNAMRSEIQEVVIPSPNGEFETFIIEPTQIPAPEVAHLYTIKTFNGRKKDDPTTLIACDISANGFHAAVYTRNKTYVIEPIDAKVSNKLVAYFMKDDTSPSFECSQHAHSKIPDLGGQKFLVPNLKRDFRLAITASGEYSEEYGGTPYSTTNVLNAIASGVNLARPIWLRDLGVTFTLVTDNALIFPDPNTDPYIIGGDNWQFNLLDESHNQITMALGSAAFDVGHLILHRGIGGFAFVGTICNDLSKGKAYSGSTGGPARLWISLGSHELGHQFGSQHNFASSCSNTRDLGAAGFRYEPGSGSSIMAYASACVDADIYADDKEYFFHYASVDQIQNVLITVNCAVTDANGNPSDPVPDAKNDLTIPRQTPFILVGSATDANDPQGNLTYGWQQYDGDGPATMGTPQCNAGTDSPLFRYRAPTANNYRHFPEYSEIINGNNNNVTWEKLPCVNRTMDFSLMVRDNNLSFGRVADDRMVVTVADTGPFDVTAPNGGENINGNSAVTWTVNGTDNHCATVDILLSTDGGMTYTVVADATANDGSEVINFPTGSNTARILVRCDVPGGFRSTSTFYDVSDANFTITGAPSCADGIQNQGEAGIDCGGPCTPCPMCDTYTLDIMTDNYPEETTWQVTDPNNNIVAQGGPYANENSMENATFCLTQGICYNFTILDSEGDGICCGFGNGSYSVRDKGEAIVAMGGEFTTMETTQICVPRNNNCANNLIFSSPNDNISNTQVLSTNENITASNVIQSGANVSYFCGTVNGKYVELVMNFTVEKGATFVAAPNGCQ